jgi:hypothetical protein
MPHLLSLLILSGTATFAAAQPQGQPTGQPAAEPKDQPPSPAATQQPTPAQAGAAALAEARAAQRTSDTRLRQEPIFLNPAGDGIRSETPRLTSSDPVRTELRVVELKRVEAFVADMGALSTSGRQQKADLRLPNDFGGVYQIPKDADTPYAGWFARARGGMIAVFPRGSYVPSDNGMVPIVPPNTRYILGNVPLGFGNASASQPAQTDHSIDGRISLRVLDDTPQTFIDGRLTTRIDETDATDLTLRSGASGRTNRQGDSTAGTQASRNPKQDTRQDTSMDALVAGGISRRVRLAEIGRAAGMKPPALAPQSGPQAAPAAPAAPQPATGEPAPAPQPDSK